MKNIFTALLLVLALCTGCATRYRVTLSNGNYYTVVGKPHLDKKTNHYIFKDAASGQQMEVSKLSIREIEPQSMEEADKNKYLPTNGN